MFLTPTAIEKYKKELTNLEEILPSLIRETGAMAALGDRSENAGYINAKSNMRKTQARIRYLTDLIKHVKVIKNNNSGFAEMGSLVVLLNASTNKKEEYVLVDSLEADPINGYISVHSPLGILLLNKIINNKVILETPYFKTEYTILEIK